MSTLVIQQLFSFISLTTVRVLYSFEATGMTDVTIHRDVYLLTLGEEDNSIKVGTTCC